MPCTCYSRKKELHYQPIPMTGRNYGINKLRQSLNSADLSAPIYCYVMTTIRNYDGTLQHIGSGPNWQGGIITLCTCKHYMRTLNSAEDWMGLWVAGISSVCAGAGDRKDVLMYLMRVGRAFKSHYDLWHALPPGVRLAKATDTNPLGDVYKPLGAFKREYQFDICRYHRPLSHSRWYDMIRDIDYRRNDNNRRAALLVGDVKYIFVWDQYMIAFEGSIKRGHKKFELREFLGRLHEANQRKQ